MEITELQHLLASAQEAERNGQNNEAEELLKKILSAMDASAPNIENSEHSSYLPSDECITVKAQALIMLSGINRLVGNYTYGLEVANQALSIAESANLQAEIAGATGMIGLISTYLGNYESALEFLNTALKINEELGDRSKYAKVLGNIGITYFSLGEFDKALEFYSKASDLLEELGELMNSAGMLGNMGNVYRTLGQYDKALEKFSIQLSRSEQFDSTRGIAYSTANMGSLYQYLSSYDKALEYHLKALASFEKLDERVSVAGLMINIGNVYRELGLYDNALEYFFKGLTIFQEISVQSGIALSFVNIGNIYQDLNFLDVALEYFHKSMDLFKELGEIESQARVLGNIGNLYNRKSDLDTSLEYHFKGLELLEKLGSDSGKAHEWGNIAETYRHKGLYSKALEYFEKSLNLHEILGERAGSASVTGNIGLVYADNNYEGYDVVVAEKYFRKAISLGENIGSKVLLLKCEKALSDIYAQKGKKSKAYDHYVRYHTLFTQVQSEEASKQAQTLEYRRKVEESDRDRKINLARFQEQEKILHNILPSKIAERIVNGEKTIAEYYDSVSIFFSDIVGFTKLSQKISAGELVQTLNSIFSEFDSLARKHGLEKIKTIGDAYMAVCGAPEANEYHAVTIIKFAFDVLGSIQKIRLSTGENIDIRIGLHCGNAVAGVIGENKYSYDLWGDAVNTASRMESHGEAGKIHVSEDFMNMIMVSDGRDPAVHFIERGEMEIKGKGMMKTYFLTRSEK